MGQRTEEKQQQTRAIAASICFVMEEEEEEEEDLRTVSRTGGVAAHKRVASHAFTRTFLGRRVRCRQFTSLYSSSESVMETAIPASFLSA
jgi:hypothetical protein